MALLRDSAGRAVPILICLAVLVSAASVRAEGFRLYGSLGAGLAVSTDQLGYLGYDGIVGRAALSVGHAVSDLIVIEGQGTAAVFGSSAEDGSLLELGGGGRLDYRTPLGLHLSPAAHLHLALTGDQVRPTVDLSMAFYFELTRAFAAGPIVQYGQVIQPDGERFSTDARYFTASLGIAYRPAPDDDTAQKPRRRTLIAIREVGEAKDAPPEVPEAPEPSDELMVLIEDAVGSSSSEVAMIPPILFDYDSVEIIPCGEAALYQARDAILVHDGPVVVEGHADTTGTDGYNNTLARQRATRVRDWMAQHGIPAERMRVVSRGERAVLAEETDDSRRQLNRRVIIRLEEPKATAAPATPKGAQSPKKPAASGSAPPTGAPPPKPAAPTVAPPTGPPPSKQPAAPAVAPPTPAPTPAPAPRPARAPASKAPPSREPPP